MNRFESVTGGNASRSTRLPNNGSQVAGYNPLMWFTALLLATFLAGCGNGVTDPVLGGGGGTGLPTVTAVTPVNNSTGVPINIKFTATFSEPMALINSASFTLTCASPCVNPTGTVVLDATKRIATYTSAANLAVSQLYTATITTGAKSLATGRTLASPYVWHFTTGTTAVTMIPPRVTLTVPVTAATGVPTNTTISAVFTKDMLAATLASPAINFTVTCAAPCVSPAGAVSYDVGSKTAIYAPTAALKASTTYTATITTSATDLIGNALAGNQTTLPNNYVWTFTTAAGPVVAAPVTVLSTSPLNAATGVCPDASINATFTVPSGLRMDPATVNTTTFTVTGPGTTVVTSASVLLDVATGRTATFTPSAVLTNGVTYTATIKSGTSGVKDMAIPANAMVSDYAWSFTAGPATGICAPPVVIVNLGKASTFGMAATAGVTNTNVLPLTHIEGDVVLTATPTCNGTAAPGGVGSPGFGTCNATTPTSVPTINGTVITPTYPDTTTATAIMNDLQAAFLSITPPAGPPAAGSLGGATNIPAGTTLGGVPGSALVQGTNLFFPGAYQSLTSILVTGDLTLDAQGNPNAVFVFQSSSTVGTAAGAPGACTPSTCAHSRILLINGAKASNVWWQAGTAATLELYSEFQGNILASGTIAMKTGATSCGRLLAGAFTTGQFTFDSNIVSVPGQPFAPPATYSSICQ